MNVIIKCAKLESVVSVKSAL